MKGPEMSLFSVQRSVQEQLKKPQSKRDILMFEYKLLLLYTAQYGVYVMPQLENIQEWHGVIFVRHGLYKEGKFKFKCNFKDFPAKPPKINFVSSVYHPMVNEETGQLDIKTLLGGRWNYGAENLLCQVFQKLKSIFTDVRRLQEPASFNTQAYEQFKNDVQDFYVRVMSSVQKSKQDLYENYEGTCMRFTETDAKHQRISQQLSSICARQNLTLEEKKKQFLKYILQ